MSKELRKETEYFETARLLLRQPHFNSRPILGGDAQTKQSACVSLKILFPFARKKNKALNFTEPADALRQRFVLFSTDNNREENNFLRLTQAESLVLPQANFGRELKRQPRRRAGAVVESSVFLDDKGERWII